MTPHPVVGKLFRVPELNPGHHPGGLRGNRFLDTNNDDREFPGARLPAVLSPSRSHAAQSTGNFVVLRCNLISARRILWLQADENDPSREREGPTRAFRSTPHPQQGSSRRDKKKGDRTLKGGFLE